MHKTGTFEGHSSAWATALRLNGAISDIDTMQNLSKMTDRLFYPGEILTTSGTRAATYICGCWSSAVLELDRTWLGDHYGLPRAGDIGSDLDTALPMISDQLFSVICTIKNLLSWVSINSNTIIKCFGYNTIFKVLQKMVLEEGLLGNSGCCWQ